jgi:hypothetical protein
MNLCGWCFWKWDDILLACVLPGDGTVAAYYIALSQILVIELRDFTFVDALVVGKFEG